MNVPRKSKVITGAPSNQMDGWVGVLRRQINNILTGLLVIAAIFMFVRWRIKTAEMNRLAVANELANARTTVQRLQGWAYLANSPADIIKAIETVETSADAAISNVLNSSDATASLRGQALVLRGDLFWQPGQHRPDARQRERADVAVE